MSSAAVDILCLDLRQLEDDPTDDAGPELFATTLPALLLEVVRRFQVAPHPRTYLSSPQESSDLDNAGREPGQLALFVLGGPFKSQLVLRPPYTIVQAHRKLDKLSRELKDHIAGSESVSSEDVLSSESPAGASPAGSPGLTHDLVAAADDAFRQLQLSSEYMAHRNILFLTTNATHEDFIDMNRRRSAAEIEAVFADFAKMGSRLQILHAVSPGLDMAKEAQVVTTSLLAEIVADYADVSLEIRRLSQTGIARLLMQGTEPRPAGLRLEFPAQANQVKGFELRVDARPVVRQLNQINGEQVCRCHNEPVRRTHLKEAQDRRYCAQTRQKLQAHDVLHCRVYGKARWLSSGDAPLSRGLLRPQTKAGDQQQQQQQLRILERVPTKTISTGWLFGEPLLITPTTDLRLNLAELKRHHTMLQALLQELGTEGQSLILSTKDRRSLNRHAIWVLTPECGCNGGSNGRRCTAAAVLHRMATAEQIYCPEEPDSGSLSSNAEDDEEHREAVLLQLSAVRSVSDCNPLRYRAGLMAEVVHAMDGALE